jgi:diguanylate cyclase (GGDEF)-like protein
LREAIGAMVVRFNGRDLPRVTVSIGVAQWQDGMCNVDELRIAADRALYAAKDGGRDRVVAAAPA